MLLQLIEDIEESLDHDCYFSALALALTLPDICGKAKYPEEKSTGKRYIQWYDDCIVDLEKPKKKNGITGEEYEDMDYIDEAPYLSGEVVYKLRCSFLHQGNPNINKDEIREERCRIDQFVLIKQKKNAIDLYGDSASSFQWCDKAGNKIGEAMRTYKLNIRRLCQILCSRAKAYYFENQELFNFFSYSVEEYDPEANMERSGELIEAMLEQINKEGSATKMWEKVDE